MVASARSLLLGFLTGGASAAGLGYLKQQRLADSKDDVTSSSGSGSSKPSSALSSTSVPDSAAPSALKKRWLKALEASNWVGKSRMAMAEKDHQTGTPWDYDWDRREPDSLLPPLEENASLTELAEYGCKLEKLTPKVTRTLLLVRHGQYEIEAEDDAGQKLTPLGREQATLTGLRLKEIIERMKVTLTDSDGNRKPVTVNLIRSTMKRASETADLVLGQLGGADAVDNIQDCHLIREGAPIPPQPPISPALWNPSQSAYFEEGARIEAAFRKHIHRASSHEKSEQIDVVVCHGNVIRYFVCRSLQLPPDAWLRFGLHNASITTLTIRPSGYVSLRAMGEVGHLPIEKLTFN